MNRDSEVAMPEQRPAGAEPGVEIRTEVAWCPGCDGDSLVQVVRLAGDPRPVALCVECGAGIALWLPVDAA